MTAVATIRSALMSTEFWGLGVVLIAMTEFPHVAWPMAVAFAGYALSRGLAKGGVATGVGQ